MGMAKAELARIEGLHFQAINLLEETGAVSRCDFHEDYYESNDDDDALKHAYALGTIMVRDGKVDGSRTEFMEAIKRAHDEAGWDGCPSCAKHLED